jgi:hypothetical protein
MLAKVAACVSVVVAILLFMPNAIAEGSTDGGIDGQIDGTHINVDGSAGGSHPVHTIPQAGDMRSVSCAGTIVAGNQGCLAAILACDRGGLVGGGRQAAFIDEVLQANGTWIPVSAHCDAVGLPVITAAMVREVAVREVPVVKIGAAPAGRALVQLESLFWVNSAVDVVLPTAQILGQAVSITVHADHVAWSFGDGASADEPGVGRPFTSADSCGAKQCPGFWGHTYTQTGARRVTATVWWSASFSVAGGAAQPIPGLVQGLTDSTDVTVYEARAVLVPNPTATR